MLVDDGSQTVCGSLEAVLDGTLFLTDSVGEPFKAAVEDLESVTVADICPT